LAIFAHVDVETTGPHPAVSELLSVGATAFSSTDLQTVGEDFYTRLLPANGEFWSKVNGDTVAWWLAQNPVAYAEAWSLRISRSSRHDTAVALAAWVDKLAALDEVVFVAWPAGFDWVWVSDLLQSEIGCNPFGYSPLCLGSFCDGYGRERLPQLGEAKIPHHALSDAIAQADYHRAILGRKTHPSV
jgi:hypothetical protein